LTPPTVNDKAWPVERFSRLACLIFETGGEDKNMKSIITTYPDFQSLPRGVKKMLLASENFFFGEAKAQPVKLLGLAAQTRRIFPLLGH